MPHRCQWISIWVKVNSLLLKYFYMALSLLATVVWKHLFFMDNEHPGDVTFLAFFRCNNCPCVITWLDVVIFHFLWPGFRVYASVQLCCVDKTALFATTKMIIQPPDLCTLFGTLNTIQNSLSETKLALSLMATKYLPNARVPVHVVHFMVMIQNWSQGLFSGEVGQTFL